MRYYLFVLSALLMFKLSAEIEGTLEAKASYYYPVNKTFRRIYNYGGLYGIEGSILAYENLYVYSGISFLPTSGRSIGERDKTQLLLIPIELGLKYYIPLNLRKTDLYVGAGMLPSYLWVKNDSPFVPRKRTKWGFGGVFKAGAIFYPFCSGFFLDIFAQYYQLSMSFSNTGRTIGERASLSGVSAGGGLGYKF